MYYGLGLNIGEKVENCYGCAYDLYKNLEIGPSDKKLCILDSNKIVTQILDTKSVSIEWAIFCAESVLPIYEKRTYDKKPTKNLKNAIKWVNSRNYDITLIHQNEIQHADNAVMMVIRGIFEQNPFYSMRFAYKAAEFASMEYIQCKFNNKVLYSFLFDTIIKLQRDKLRDIIQKYKMNHHLSLYRFRVFSSNIEKDIKTTIKTTIELSP